MVQKSGVEGVRFEFDEKDIYNWTLHVTGPVRCRVARCAVRARHA